MNNLKLKTFLALGALLAGSITYGATTATTSLTGVLNAGSLAIAADSASVTFTAQSITSDGSQATVAAADPEAYTVTIEDTRGTSSAITITADITPLTLSGNIRPIQVQTGSPSGGFTAAYDQVISADTSGVTIASSTAEVNRHGDFTVTVTPQALTGTAAQSGTYSGSLVLTVQ